MNKLTGTILIRIVAALAQIDGIQSVTGEAVGTITAVSGVIDRVAEAITTIAATVNEQITATQEIARDVQDAASGTGEVATSIAVVSRIAQDTGDAATELVGASRGLSRQAVNMQSYVDEFVTQLNVAWQMGPGTRSRPNR